MRLVAVCWIGQSPQRGEVWDLFRHLSNKTIYVKLRHHYFVAVLQAYTVYYAQDQQGWVYEIRFSPVSMPNVHFITFDWQKSTMLFCLPVSLPLKSPIKCHFIDNWFAGVPFLSYRYLTKQICICLQQSCLLPVTRSELTWIVSELFCLQGCSFITLLSWLTTEFSHQNLFDTFWWEIGVQCVTAGSIFFG